MIVAIGLLGGPLPRPAVAQYVQPGTADELNFAFASQLGSGVYEISGHLVQIYRIPFQLSVEREDETSPRLRVNLPVSLGFFDLSRAEADQPERPSHFATASFVPGVALEIALRENWSVEPFAEVGFARDFHNHQHAYVYALGAKSLATFHPTRLEVLLGHRIFYAGERVQGSDLDQDFAALESGLEARRVLPFRARGHQLTLGLYVVDYLYIEPTKVFFESKPAEIGNQIELGFTLGTRVPVPLWRFECPRLGLGYRFGDSVTALRFVIGSAF